MRRVAADRHRGYRGSMQGDPTQYHHPLAQYFARKYHFAPIPSGVRGLFDLLYRPFDDPSVKSWGSWAKSSPDFRAAVFTGRLFAPPDDWPAGWPDDWPKHVRPIHLLRAFGSRGVKGPDYQVRYWTNFEGAMELAAYWSGVSLTRAETTLAARGARVFLRQPQFLVYAHNVSTITLPRLDVEPSEGFYAQQQLHLDPLGASDAMVRLALPPWAQQVEVLQGMRRPFDPFRTLAPDLVKRRDQALVPFEPARYEERTLKDPPPTTWKRPFTVA